MQAYSGTALNDSLYFCEKVVYRNLIIIHITTYFTFCTHDLHDTCLFTCKAAHAECRCCTAFELHVGELMVDSIIIQLIDAFAVVRFMQCLEKDCIGRVVCKCTGPIRCSTEVVPPVMEWAGVG